LRLVTVVALAVVHGTVGSSFAAPPSSSSPPPQLGLETESARAFVELRLRGNTAYKAGRIEEAIDAWTRAYAIEPSYVVACAAGRVELLTRKNALAGAKWLTRCVNLAPLHDAEQERKAQREEIVLRDLARSRVAAVRVRTEPGATVTVDGSVVGRAPLGDEVFLPPGSHRLVVSLGNRSQSIEVTLAAGESRTVDLLLPPPSSAPPPPSTTPPSPAPSSGPSSSLPLLNASQAIPVGGSSSSAVGNVAKESNTTLLGTGIAVGAVGFALTVGFGAAAFKARGEENEVANVMNERYGYVPCTTPDLPGCPILKYKSDEADTLAAVSLVGLSAAVIGGVMIAYAILEPQRRASEPGVRAAFVGAPGSGGLVLVGQF
jgi:hypothetical protein